MSSNNLISLISVSNLRLEQFRTQHELARNFYDDHEFCPVYHIEEVTEHRERIQKRTSPYPSPSHSPEPSYYVSPKQQQRPHYSSTTYSSSSSISSTASSSTTRARAIPIIDPSNMTPVSVPVVHPSYSTKSTSPSMAQWVAYMNNSGNTSPISSHSSISSMSSSISNSTYGTSYYYGNTTPSCAINYNNRQYQQPTPVVARAAIPIIDPATRQAYRQQQQNIPPPGFYNVSVC